MSVEISMEGLIVVLAFLLFVFVVQLLAIRMMVKKHVYQRHVIEVKDAVIKKKRGKR